MGVLSDLVDRALNTTAADRGAVVSQRAIELHASTPVVDLVVGTALFRDRFLSRGRYGHVDLPRLRQGGVRLVGLTVATRHPDRRGTLSNVHFRSLGMPAARLRSNMAIAGWVIDRIERWSERSRGRLLIIRTREDLAACLAPDGPVGAFLGIQGGHVLDGDPSNVDLLNRRGVRMFAPAHVMDNELVGSGTGRRAGGLTGLGREVVAEVQRAGMIVDLAHMSAIGIADTLPLLEPPFALSHTGLTELSGKGSRWRRYTPRRRNVPAALARDVGAAGGVVGVITSSRLLGGESIDRAAETIQLVAGVAGAGAVAIGSDMDGGLRSVMDARGYPALIGRLLARGMPPEAVSSVLGGNAIRLLDTRLPSR